MTMKTGDDDDALEKLLAQGPEHRAPEDFCARVVAEAGKTRQRGLPGWEWLKQGLPGGWRLPVFSLIPAAALVVVLGVVLIQPPAEEPAAVAQPMQGVPPTPREAMPEMRQLSEREFEVVLVLDTLMESEEAEIWAEDPQLYF
jgi:anti-sigma-K factor RskA